VDYLLQVFKALANDRRLQMIELLLDREDLPIEGIASRLKIPLATRCRNLKVLERTYLVSSRGKKGYVFYRLNQPDGHAYNRLVLELIKRRKRKKNRNRLRSAAARQERT
jgi:DNA-binding transcriptional ArsR family regulator